MVIFEKLDHLRTIFKGTVVNRIRGASQQENRTIIKSITPSKRKTIIKF